MLKQSAKTLKLLAGISSKKQYLRFLFEDWIKLKSFGRDMILP